MACNNQKSMIIFYLLLKFAIENMI